MILFELSAEKMLNWQNSYFTGADSSVLLSFIGSANLVRMKDNRVAALGCSLRIYFCFL